MHLIRRSAMAFLAFALGCSPDSGGDGPNTLPISSSPKSFEFVSTDPADGALRVPTTQSISVTFTDTVVLSSVGPSTIAFWTAEGPLTGAYGVAGNTVIFFPDAELPYRTWVTGLVTTSVYGNGGGELAEEIEWEFRTESGPEVLAAAGEIDRPRLAVSEGGMVMLTWRETAGGQSSILSRSFTSDAGWTPEFTIDSSADWIDNLDMKGLAGNEFVAWWWGPDGTGFAALRTALYTPAGGWGAPQTLATDVNTNYAPEITLHPAGFGAIVYRTGFNGQSWMRYRSDDATWQTAIGAATGGGRICADSNGNLHSFYQVINPATGSGQLVTIRYNPATGWTTAGSGGGAGTPPFHMAADANGNVLAVAAGFNSWNCWWFNGTAWSVAPGIAGAPTQGGPMSNPILSMDGSGVAILTWNRQAQFGDLCGARFIPGTGWESLQILEALDAPTSIPAAAATSTGGYVVFPLWNGTAYSTSLVRFESGTGWAAPEPLSDESMMSWYQKVVATADVQVATWLRDNGGTTELIGFVLE